MSKRRLQNAVLLPWVVASFAAASVAHADVPQPPALRNVDVVEHLGERVPLDVHFVDQNGKSVELGDYLKQGKPVLLSLVYFRCPMLCSLILSGITKVMRDMDLHLGQDYGAVTVSFDPADNPATATTKQTNYLQALGKPGAAADWPYLTGSKDQIERLTQALGFQYTYDEQTQQFAHPAVVFILSPDGRISRYLYDFNFEPRQLKLALVEAAAGKAGSTVDRVLLQCYRYDPASRKYHFFVTRFMQTGGAIVLLSLAGLIGWLIYRYR